MKINTFVKIGLLCIWFIGITTCTSDEHAWQRGNSEQIDTTLFKEGTVPVLIPVTKSPNDNDPENRIVSVRIIVIKQDRVTNNKVINNINASETNIQLTDLVPVGTVDFFVIVNELSNWDLNGITIGNTYFSNNLKQKLISYNSGLPVVDATHPIPMFEMYENLQITESGNTLLNNISVTLSSVKRLYAKVTLNLKSIFEDLDNGGDPIEIKQVSIKRMPKESYLAPLSYTKNSASDFFSGTLALTPNTNYFVYADSFKSNFICYIPEYLVSEIDSFTYISAVVNLVGDVNSEREYKIVLGDGISNGNTYMLGNTKLYSDVRISRNKWYQLDIKIKSFDIRGEEDIEIRPIIVPWDTSIPVDSTGFRDHILTVSQDIFQLAAVSFDGIVEITTDHPGGWSANLAPKQSGTLRTTLNTFVGTSGTGVLKFHYNGQSITEADTIKVTAGAVTKSILIKN
ncbi:MAG: hypothetical protein LBB84_04505 [Tannerellaceae bacterium]|jgi:hypothetical protein|nr:hypothetical protein [Tannerellaceae bacterium]